MRVYFDLPDEYAALLVEAMAASYRYQPTIPDPANPDQQIANPQTPAEFARLQVVKYCHEVVKSYQVAKAAEVARKAKEDELAASVDLSLIQTGSE